MLSCCFQWSRPCLVAEMRFWQNNATIVIVSRDFALRPTCLCFGLGTMSMMLPCTMHLSLTLLCRSFYPTTLFPPDGRDLPSFIASYSVLPLQLAIQYYFTFSRRITTELAVFPRLVCSIQCSVGKPNANHDR